MTGVAGVAGSFNARGLAWRFYRAYPRLSIDVHRQEAVKALNGLIQYYPSMLVLKSPSRGLVPVIMLVLVYRLALGLRIL
jgi:hypothetical protein